MAFLLLAPAITTALDRPRVLRNLVPFSEDVSQWSSVGATVFGPLGLNALGQFPGYAVTSTGQTWNGSVALSLAVNAGDVFSVRLLYRAGTFNAIRLSVGYSGVSKTRHNLIGVPGALPSSSGSIVRLSATLQSDGLTYEGIFRITAIGPSECQFRIGPNSAVAGQNVIILAAQIEVGDTVTPYQATP